MNDRKGIFWIIAAVVALAAAITTIVVFRNEIERLFEELKMKIDEKKTNVLNNGYSDDEYSDYADV